MSVEAAQEFVDPDLWAQGAPFTRSGWVLLMAPTGVTEADGVLAIDMSRLLRLCCHQRRVGCR